MSETVENSSLQNPKIGFGEYRRPEVADAFGINAIEPVDAVVDLRAQFVVACLCAPWRAACAGSLSYCVRRSDRALGGSWRKDPDLLGQSARLAEKSRSSSTGTPRSSISRTASPSSARRLSASAAIGPPRTAKAFDISEEPNSRDLTWVSGKTPVNEPAALGDQIIGRVPERPLDNPLPAGKMKERSARMGEDELVPTLARRRLGTVLRRGWLAIRPRRDHRKRPCARRSEKAGPSASR